MTPYEIALFKTYIDGKGMATPFIQLFRKYRIRTNPTHIEDYFKSVDAKSVCMKAFYWLTNSRWGYDYWRDVQNGFDEYLRNKRATREEDTELEWWSLHGMYKILRTNWDAEKHWKMETVKKAELRLGIIKREEREDRLPIEIVSFGSDDDADDLDDEKDIKTTHDPLSEFNFVDISPRRSVLKPDEASINTRNKKFSLTFNQPESLAIHNKGFKYAALMRNNRGDIVVLVNETTGVKILDTTMNEKGGNCVINNKQLISRIIAFLDIKDDYKIIKVKVLAKNEECIAYQLINN